MSLSENYKLARAVDLQSPKAHPTRLDLAHKRRDEAIFAAYGWKSDLCDEELLEKLLIGI